MDCILQRAWCENQRDSLDGKYLEIVNHHTKKVYVIIRNSVKSFLPAANMYEPLLFQVSDFVS